MAAFLPLVVRLTKEGKTAALIDSNICWYPPAFARAGADLRYVMLVSPRRPRELLWVTEQCFASEAIALTIAHVEGLKDLELRRLGLMAENGGNGCVLLRPLHELHHSAASLRLVIRPWPGKPDKQSFHVEIARVRGALPPPPMILEFDHESPLAVSATAALPLSAGDTGKAAASA
ncbi:MAG: hypothetical protein HUU29_13185 [Planctomycetaceae bacterium]|nr:hypothetical protein [Planctomycetaceae bacterium]